MTRVRLSYLGSDSRSVAAVEFAMVGAAFILFLLAVIGVGMNFYFQQVLDFATIAAARQVQLGYVPATYTENDFIVNVLCPSFGQLQVCTNLFADVRPVTDYQQLTNPSVTDSPDSTSTTGFTMCPGQPGQLMYVHVVYLPPSIGALFGLSNLALVSNASFANENPSGLAVVQTNGC